MEDWLHRCLPAANVFSLSGKERKKWQIMESQSLSEWQHIYQPGNRNYLSILNPQK